MSGLQLEEASKLNTRISFAVHGRQLLRRYSNAGCLTTDIQAFSSHTEKVLSSLFGQEDYRATGRFVANSMPQRLMTEAEPASETLN
jgi:hypothetical protein